MAYRVGAGESGGWLRMERLLRGYGAAAAVSATLSRRRDGETTLTRLRCCQYIRADRRGAGAGVSTVSAWLKRVGLGKRSRLEPPEPPNRYERGRPGELVHVDIKKLGRISRRGAGHRVVGHRKSQ